MHSVVSQPICTIQYWICMLVLCSCICHVQTSVCYTWQHIMSFVWMQLAIYSPADRLQPHRYKADESYEISGPEMTPVQSYLDVEAIIALAKQQSVDAIHPGYGFLSENTTFARRCGEEGIVFIGPTAKTIEVSILQNICRASLGLSSVLIPF